MMCLVNFRPKNYLFWPKIVSPMLETMKIILNMQLKGYIELQNYKIMKLSTPNYCIE